MPKVKKVRTRQKRISKRGGIRKAVYLTKEQLESVAAIKAEFRKELKETITLAYVIREGVDKQILSMRSDLRKAKKGAYHAKPRKNK